MNLFEDALRGSALTIAVASAAVAIPVLLPAVAPALGPPLRNALKLGISLFLESSSEAEGELVQKLVQTALEGVLAALSGPGSDGHKRKAATAQIRHFEARARRRAERFAWDDQDAEARYRRQVASLKRALSAAKEQRPAIEPALDHVSEAINEDW